MQNRVIKFRAWDAQNNEMTHTVDLWCYPEDETEFHGNVLNPDTGDEIYCFPNGKDTFLMQFTGLHDKNGKEIYEGDIVKPKYDVPFVVEYGLQEVDAFVGMGFNLWSFYDSVYGEYVANNNRLINEHEVIGNIHQNPELLK